MADPDLKLDALSICIHSRQFPAATDFYDANWLVLRATVERGHTSVTADGAILMTTDFERFRDQLSAMNETVTGDAELCGSEPNLKVTLTASRLGHIECRIEITPDHLGEWHRFEARLDQTYLPAVIASCDAIINSYPVVNRDKA